MNGDDEDLLDERLERWEESHERGQDVSADELCRDCPHLVGELARRIKALSDVSLWLDPNQPVLVEKDQGEPNLPSRSVPPRILAGQYRLDELIAEGGHGQVWKGFDLELQRVVAVKIPKPSRSLSVEVFIAEARKVAKLEHPHIIPIFHVGREGDSCFLVFPFIIGGSLADLIRRNPVSPTEAARRVAEIAEALDYAHQQGFIHRDIKPENVLLDHRGRALLTDFGISIRNEEVGCSSLGTLSYMSSEQIEGEPVNARSDLYSLGVVLHELLTRRVPCSSDDPNMLLREIVTSGATANDMLAELSRICRKALERLPAARYSSARELANDLRAFVQWADYDYGGEGL